MSHLLVFLLAIAFALSALAAVLVAGVIIIFRIDDWWEDRRRARRRAQHGLSDREVADALAPFGADISIWPERAPRNGSTYEDDLAG